jgi:hypothetical protein
MSTQGRHVPPSDAQVVLDMGYAENAFHDVLGSPTRLTTVDSAAERYLAPAHLDLDVRCVDVGVVVQLIADVLTDALV